jgi:CheY-like chemotaxis protein/HPt (histidine-containing phosphotransfer) domain-containing protein
LLKAEEKNIDFRIQTDSNLPKRFIGDPTRLNQILLNLAGNAVKFTEKGYVEIKTTVRKRDSRYWLQFDVIDTGIGIAKHHLDNIFDSFTQAGADVTRKFGGTGLGLTISKQMTNLMGGDISVKSELNKGTVFTAVIPFDEAAVQEVGVKASVVTPEAIARLNKMTVLLAEDNEFNQMVAIETLKDNLPGIKIDTVINGEEAIEALTIGNYDLILMDVQMPVMDGVTATEKIRNELPEPARSTKIIAMTANVLQEDVLHYMDIGMNGHVSKPFQVDELLAMMDKVVLQGAGTDAPAIPVAATPVVAPVAPAPPPVPKQEEKSAENEQANNQKFPPRNQQRGRFPGYSNTAKGNQPAPKPVQEAVAQRPATAVQEKPVAEPPAAPKESQRPLPALVTDRNFLKQFTGGNPEKMHKYVSIFLQNAPKILDSMEQALNNNDYGAIKIAAHSLKPQLAYMGIKEDVSHVYKLEQMAGNSPDFAQLKDEVRDLKRVCKKAFEELNDLG